MINFTFSNWAISLQSISAQQYDEKTIQMVFVGDFSTEEIAPFTNWQVYIKNNRNLDLVDLEDVEDGKAVLLSREQTAFSGPYYVQVIGSYTDENGEYHERHTNKAEFILPSSLDGNAQWNPIPHAFTEAVVAAQGFAEEAAQTAAEIQRLVPRFSEEDIGKILSVADGEHTVWIPTERGDIDAVKALIPEEASADNQLADKSFVNSTVGTNTAIFRGTYDSVSQLPTSGITNNDYAFVQDTSTTGILQYKRYKYNGSSWVYEYTLNNSSFTAEQWAAINSGAAAASIAKIATTENALNAHKINHNNPHSVTAEQVGARADTWLPTAAQIGVTAQGKLKIGATEYTLQLGSYTAGAAGYIRFSTS